MATVVSLNGAELTLDPSGAAWWSAERTLVVADLHLEKGSSYWAAGRLLPPYDTRATIERLALVLRRYRPQRVVALGDSFHDGAAVERMDASDRTRLAELVTEHEWLWIAGNHDPVPPRVFAADIGGRVEEALVMAPLVFRHEPSGEVSGEVCGHFHPKAAVRARGRRISGRAFVTDGMRLIMPAFGAYAGGLDALDPAITRCFRGDVRIYLIGRAAIYLFAADRLEQPSRGEMLLASR